MGSFLAAAGVVGEVACPSDEGENKISFLIFVVLFHLTLFFVSSPTIFSAQARRPARRWWWLLAGLSAPPPSSSASPSSSRSTSRGDLSHSHIEIKPPFPHPHHLQDGQPTSSLSSSMITIWPFGYSSINFPNICSPRWSWRLLEINRKSETVWINWLLWAPYYSNCTCSSTTTLFAYLYTVVHGVVRFPDWLESVGRGTWLYME